MYTPIHAQIIADTISGSNTSGLTDSRVLYSRKSLEMCTRMTYCSLLISNFCFSDDVIGTNRDILNSK